MRDNVTVVATVVDDNLVRVCCLSGDYTFVRESLRMSYDNACKLGYADNLKRACVRFSGAQLVIDDKVVAQERRYRTAYGVMLKVLLRDDYTFERFCDSYKLYGEYVDRLNAHIDKEVHNNVVTR